MKRLITLSLAILFTYIANAVNLQVEISISNTNKVYNGKVEITKHNVIISSNIDTTKLAILYKFKDNDFHYTYMLKDKQNNVFSFIFSEGVIYLYDGRKTKYKSEYILLNIVNP